MTVFAAWISIGAPLAGRSVDTAAGTGASESPGPRGRVVLIRGGRRGGEPPSPACGHPDRLPVEHNLAWLDYPIRVSFGVLIDPLSIVLANVVAVISFIIMVYCGRLHEG